MFGVETFAEKPIGSSFPPNTYNGDFVDLVIDTTADSQYLVEISAYAGGTVPTGRVVPFSEQPFSDVQGGGDGNQGIAILTYADRHWVGAPSDAGKPNAYYEGRLSIPLIVEREMPVLPEESRRVQRQFGLLEIANGDGELDSVLLSHAVDGRQVRVLFGPYMGAYSDFQVIADVVGTGWAGDDLAVQLGLRDRSYNLDLPVQTTLYLGTGGAEGGDEIEGKPKPLCYGLCRNITPTLIDPANLIYQFHDGSVLAVDAVYDRGAELTDSATDVSGYANLVSQSVSSSNFATALDVGMFKLGSSPDGLVTCDVRGENDPSYVDSLQTISLRILTDRAQLSTEFINTGTFPGAGSIGGTMGVYISHNETPTTAGVMDVLFGSCAAWWGSGRDGRIRAGLLGDPTDRTPVLYLDEYNILKLEPEEAPVPRWRQRVGYQRNWTVQRGEDLASSVTDARRQFLTDELRVATAADVTTVTRHVQALDPDVLPSLYDSSTDADALADYLLTLHSPDRRIFRITLKRLGYLLNLQSVVHVIWPRLGLSGGKKFVVTGIREDAQRDETVITIWG